MNEPTPISMHNLNSLLQASYDDDTYDYIRRDYISCEVGLVDGPIQGISVRRGGDRKDLLKEITELQEVLAEQDDLEGQWETPSEALVQWEARVAKFAATAPEELYVVLHDDCREINPPLSIAADEAGIDDPNWSTTIYDEWNVLANFREYPKYQEVWDRRKLTFEEAAQRISQLQSLPPKPPRPNVVDPFYVQEINKLLSQVVLYDENMSPYNLVVEQKRIRRDLEQWYTILASRKLMVLMGGHIHVGPLESGDLVISQTQYDDWHGLHKVLSGFCQIQPWVNAEYANFPAAAFDVSGDHDFEYSPRKSYTVHVQYYDAHSCGF